MERILWGFLVAVLVSVLLWRSALFDEGASLVDLSDSGEHRPRFALSLPPSSYEPGHLLLDTLKNDKFHEPPYMDLGIYAWHQFLESPPEIRKRVMASLGSSIIDLDEWLDYLDRANIEFLCLGESHQENYRDFFADKLLARYRVDTLILETSKTVLPVTMLRTNVGDRYVNLLRADISNVIRAVRERNPDTLIVGGDETWRQENERKSNHGGGLRDKSILENIVDNFVPGRRHAVVFGALHCTHHRTWLYSQLKRPDSPLAGASMLNVGVMSKRKDTITRAFSTFLRLAGIERSTYVINNTAELDPLFHDWFLGLSGNLANYTTVVIFD